MSVLRPLLAILLLVSALAACGSNSKPLERKPASTRLVDPAITPFVNGLEVESGSGDFLLTTNKGFWRIDPDTEKVTPIKGKITAGSKSDTVGTFLFVMQAEDGRWIGSGHPDDEKSGLPSYLGFIESTDKGKTWRAVARLAEADLHKIISAHGKLYAFDAILGAMLISSDNLKTFKEEFTPRGLTIDFVVDPTDENHLFASTEEGGLHESLKGGDGWRPVGTGEGIRLAWPAADALYRATKDGTVERSSDSGGSWRKVGAVPGEPYKIRAMAAEHLFIALADGTIVETKDGGRTFTEAFRP